MHFCDLGEGSSLIHKKKLFEVIFVKIMKEDVRLSLYCEDCSSMCCVVCVREVYKVQQILGG